MACVTTSPLLDGFSMTMRAALRDPRLVLAVVAIAAVVIADQFGLFTLGTIDTIRNHRDSLTDWVDDNLIVAVAIYVSVYVGAVALSVPFGSILTVSGGFLFGATLGLPLAVISATLGAACLFLIVRRLFGDDLLGRLGPGAQRLAAGLKRDAAPLLLALRIAPVVPFFIVNLVPALIGVPLRTYVLTTFFGVIPVTTVFALAGAGLGSMLDRGDSVTMAGILTPEIIAGLILLASVTLLSIPIRRWAAQRA
jgi:uncharacterized membrane protein YdjX (TVP38/TMEM64 family)